MLWKDVGHTLTIMYNNNLNPESEISLYLAKINTVILEICV